MDKYEYRLKTEHIRQVAMKKQYAEAARLCDSIDWNRVRDVKMLTTVADIYTAVGRYQEAMNVLVKAYEYAPIGRRIVYRLTELALAADNYEEAKDYFDEFCKIAPNDQGRYILLYKMACQQHATIGEKIQILEAYRREDFDEKWAYELALLYSKSHKIEKCVQLCDDIVLWFGLGNYVEKALNLKQMYAPLTEEQQAKAKEIARQKETRQYEERNRQIAEIQGVPDTVNDLKVDSELDRVGKVTAEAVRSIERETARQQAELEAQQTAPKAAAVFVAKQAAEPSVETPGQASMESAADVQEQNKESAVQEPTAVQRLDEEDRNPAAVVLELSDSASGPMQDTEVKEERIQNTSKAEEKAVLSAEETPSQERLDSNAPTKTDLNLSSLHEGTLAPTRTDIWQNIPMETIASVFDSDIVEAVEIEAAEVETMQAPEVEDMSDDRLAQAEVMEFEEELSVTAEPEGEIVVEPVQEDGYVEEIFESSEPEEILPVSEMDSVELQENEMEEESAKNDLFDADDAESYEPEFDAFEEDDEDPYGDDEEDDGTYEADPDDFKDVLEDAEDSEDFEEYEEVSDYEDVLDDEDEYELVADEEAYEEVLDEDEYEVVDEADLYDEPLDDPYEEDLEDEAYEVVENSYEEVSEEEILDEKRSDETADVNAIDADEAKATIPVETYEEVIDLAAKTRPAGPTPETFSGMEGVNVIIEDDEEEEPQDVAEVEDIQPARKKPQDADAFLRDLFDNPAKSFANSSDSDEEDLDDAFDGIDSFGLPVQGLEKKHRRREKLAKSLEAEMDKTFGQIDEKKDDAEPEGVILNTNGRPEFSVMRESSKKAESKEKPKEDFEEPSGVTVQEAINTAIRAGRRSSGKQPESPEDFADVWHFSVGVSDRNRQMDAVMRYLRKLAPAVKDRVPRQIARISGGNLNNKNIVESFDAMIGKTVVVLNAGDMEKRVVKEFCQVLHEDDHSLLMVLVDQRNRMDSLLYAYPELKDIFTASFSEGEIGADELMQYAKEIMERQDYVLDESAEEIVYEKIADVMKNSSDTRKRSLEVILKGAMENAAKKRGGLFTSRYDREGRIIVREKHFQD